MALSGVGEAGGGVEADNSQAARIRAKDANANKIRKRLVVMISSLANITCFCPFFSK
jgi:hypothetical protein